MKAQEHSQGSKPTSAAWAFPFWIAILDSTLRGYTTAFDVPSGAFTKMVVPHSGAKAADRSSMPSADGMECLGAEADQCFGVVRNES
jgi:hypothetical protein